MKDSLGDRMKSNYEDRFRYLLPNRAYTIIRLDGKAFHTYTRNLEKPFDIGFIEDMDLTASYLCKNIMGAKFAFVQSDEISILLTDFDTIDTQSWFNNNLQKMCSVSASMATKEFNKLRIERQLKEAIELDENLPEYCLEEIKDLKFKFAEFDSRVFQIPSKSEVMNYFIWRQQDTVRNSIQSVAQTLYSHKELHGKNQSDLQEMIFQKGINWNNYESKFKRGRLIHKETNFVHQEERNNWVSLEVPIFTQAKEYLNSLVPENL